MRRGQVPRPRGGRRCHRPPALCYETLVDRRRRLFWHGIFLFFLGLVVGAFVQRMTNPRMGLSAHLGGVMTGTFLAVLGAAWTELRLSPRAESAAYWLALFGSYGSSASRRSSARAARRRSPAPGTRRQRGGRRWSTSASS